MTERKIAKWNLRGVLLLPVVFLALGLGYITLALWKLLLTPSPPDTQRKAEELLARNTKFRQDSRSQG